MLLNEKHKITVCIPVRNGARFIGRAIESILGQTFQNFRLVIADNCSTDDTQLVVGRYLSDNRVTLVQRPYDMGLMGNFNACIESVDTKYYMILCHDDFLCDNNVLEVGFRILEENFDVPAVYCATLFVDKFDKVIAKRSFGISGLIESDVVAKNSVISGRNIYGVPLLIRACAIKNNKYDGSFPNSGDIDFSIAIGKNKKVYFINDTFVAIRFHKVNNTARIFKTLEDEFLRIAEKHKIKLTNSEKIRMKINNLMVCTKKKLFFYYLDNIRK